MARWLFEWGNKVIWWINFYDNVWVLIYTYLSIKTLHQHFRYYEYHQKSYISTDYPEISAIDISEIKSFPVSSENIEVFNDVLIRCSKLFSVQKGEYIDRALALYHKWFDRLSPLSFVPLLSEDISGENIGRIETSKVGLFLQHWGTVAAELNIPLIKINNNMSFPGLYSVFSFGNPYFKYCIEYKKYCSVFRRWDRNWDRGRTKRKYRKSTGHIWRCDQCADPDRG